MRILRSSGSGLSTRFAGVCPALRGWYDRRLPVPPGLFAAPTGLDLRHMLHHLVAAVD